MQATMSVSTGSQSSIKQRSNEQVFCFTQKYHPVYVLGLTSEQLNLIRSTYSAVYGNDVVGFYDMLDYSKLPDRIGIEPAVVILAEHIAMAGSIREFLKRTKTPVLRIMREPVQAAHLPSSYYYNGVYDTIGEQDTLVPERLHFHLSMGILLWEKNKERRRTDEEVQRTFVIETNDPRGSKARKRLHVPAPEKTWTAFMKKFMATAYATLHDCETHHEVQPARFARKAV